MQLKMYFWLVYGGDHVTKCHMTFYNMQALLHLVSAKPTSSFCLQWLAHPTGELVG